MLRFKGDAVRVNNLHFQKLVNISKTFLNEQFSLIYLFVIRNNCIGTIVLKTESLSGSSREFGASSSAISPTWDLRDRVPVMKGRELKELFLLLSLRR